MCFNLWICTIILLFNPVVVLVTGHGFLQTPIPRARLWRHFSNLAPFYDDNGIYCSNLITLPILTRVTNLSIACSECGLKEFDTRTMLNENVNIITAGLYTNRFSLELETMTVAVHLTTNHLGRFYIEVAVHNNYTFDGTFMMCTKLNTSNVELEYNLVGEKEGLYTTVLPHINDYIVKLNMKNLPRSCLDGCPCVMRWTYVSGNNWGCEKNGINKENCGLGIGPQIVFRNCADFIIIKASTSI